MGLRLFTTVVLPFFLFFGGCAVSLAFECVHALQTGDPLFVVIGAAGAAGGVYMVVGGARAVLRKTQSPVDIGRRTR